MAGRRELRVDEDGWGGLDREGAGLGSKLKEVWGELEPEAAAGEAAMVEAEASKPARKGSTKAKSLMRCCLMSSRVELCSGGDAIGLGFELCSGVQDRGKMGERKERREDFELEFWSVKTGSVVE